MNRNITLTNLYVIRNEYCVKLAIHVSRITHHASKFQREVNHG